MRSGSTTGIGFFDVGFIRVAIKDNITGSVGDCIVGVGSHVVKELVNSGHCVFCGCGLSGAY